MPVIPYVKVVIDGQAALNMLLFLKCEKGGAFLNAKRVEVSLELIQKLGMDKEYTQKVGVTDLLRIGCGFDLRDVIRP